MDHPFVELVPMLEVDMIDQIFLQVMSKTSWNQAVCVLTMCVIAATKASGNHFTWNPLLHD